MKMSAVFLLFVPSLLFGQDPFDGTWRMKMETLEFSNTPKDDLLAQGTTPLFFGNVHRL
jgi:hypothetical protein